MSDPAIAIRSLSKEYRLGQAQSAYSTVRESLAELVRRPWRKADPETLRPETVWALRDVSLDVPPGQVVGLIGRNGAGKSTLLKMLSRITEPTSGEISLRGRVGSLLEVGTGFHPELTGRENIYLNGAILGMRRAEIARKFSEIVEFAEVERFLDTPVKRFSSGMYMRLAFAVAAHLEPDILLVDEVLAVGDASFQKKCLGRMQDVASHGRTVVFVSHNMASIRSLCERSVLLVDGRVEFDGPTATAIDRYQADVRRSDRGEVELAGVFRPSPRSAALHLERLVLRNGSAGATLGVGQPIELDIGFSVTETIHDLAVGIAVTSPDNVLILECRSSQFYGPIPSVRAGRYQLRCRLEDNVLSPGLYFLGVGARSASHHLDFVPRALTFEVVTTARLESVWMDQVGGVVRADSVWSEPRLVADQETGSRR